MQAAARTDSKYWTKQFLSDKNFIVKGFNVTGLGLNTVTVNMTNSTLIYSENTSDFSFYIAEDGAANIIVPASSLIDGVRNYLEIRIITEDGTPITGTFWDPSANSGVGGEFNQLVNSMTDLKCEIVVTQTGFTGLPDRLPLAIVDVNNSGVITTILDERKLFFLIIEF